MIYNDCNGLFSADIFSNMMDSVSYLRGNNDKNIKGFVYVSRTWIINTYTSGDNFTNII